MPPAVSMGEVARHAQRGDLWNVIGGVAYDVTGFVNDHPGGAEVLMLHAGKAVPTAEFTKAHPLSVIAKTQQDGGAGATIRAVGAVPDDQLPADCRADAAGEAAEAFDTRYRHVQPHAPYGRVDASFVAALRGACGVVHWQEDTAAGAQAAVAAASGDKSFHRPHRPDVVVEPVTAEEVAAVVRLCQRRRVPLTARGAGSGLEGACIPVHGGVVLDTIRFKSVECDEEEMTARVGPAVLKTELNERLKQYGLFFGPDPASNPSVGGMCATGGSGMSTLKFGTTRENVVSLEVVTAEGDIIRTRRDVRKSSTGYELTQLYLGSEGTLGIITNICVRLRRIPKVRRGALVSFGDCRSAVEAVVSMVRADLLSLVRCEMLNAEGVKCTNTIFDTDLPEQPTLFMEFQSMDEAIAAKDSATAEQLCRDRGAVKYDEAKDAARLDKVWEARRGCYLAAMKYRGTPGGDHVYVGDVCVPRKHLAAVVAETERDVVESGFPCAICAHISDGNFHCLIPHTAKERERMLEVEERCIERGLAAGGTVSGEHGVGMGKIPKLLKEHGAAHVDLQRRIKRAIDPNNIMNPGKVLEWDGSHPAAAGGGGVVMTARACAAWAARFVALCVVVLTTVAGGVFSRDKNAAAHRSAVFLTTFAVVHVAGNLSCLAGAEAFNVYGEKLRSNPLIAAVEAYLLVAFAVHAGAAVLLSWGKRRYLAGDPWRRARLAGTGTVLVVFLVVHLRHFRFGDVPLTADGSARDLHARAVDVLADPANVALYVGGSLSLGVHLWVGWEKTVPRFPRRRLVEAERPGAVAIGRFLTVAVTAGFVACVAALALGGGAATNGAPHPA